MKEQLQRTDQWFSDRLGIPTASKYADVMAKIKTGEAAARKKYRTELVLERLLGIPVDSYKSTAMQWGIDHEPIALLEFQLRTGIKVQETGFHRHPTLETGASPDGLIDDDGTVEIKCPESSTHLLTLQTRKMPSTYKWQVQGQLWVTNRKYCWFISYDPRMPANAQLFYVRVERDEKMISELATNVELFMQSVRQEEEFLKTWTLETAKTAETK